MNHLLTTETARPLRAIIYTRLSSWSGEDDSSTSPERQRQVCKDYAASQGWEIVDVIEDLNVSGSDKGLRLNRPGLTRVREAFDSVDVVIFAKLDRLARSVVDFNQFATEAREHDVALVSVAERLDLSTSMGRFVANMLAAFAEMEAATIADRVRAGIAGTIVAGRWPNGNPPFGYKIVPHESGRGVGLAIDEVEGPIIRRMVDELLTGRSAYAVSHGLNNDGLRTRRGAEWSIRTIQRTLVLDSMCGCMTHRKQVVRDESGLPKRFWEPLITDSEMARLRPILTPSTALPKRKASRLLSGMCVCASCGRGLVVGVSSNKVVAYRCPSRALGKPCPRGVGIPAEDAEAHVTERVLDLLGDLPIVRIEEIEDDGERVTIEAAIAATTSEMASPDADLDALTKRLRALHARRADLDSAPRPTSTRTVADGTFRELWDADDDVAYRRDLLGDVIGKVIVAPAARRVATPAADRITIQWSGDTNAEEAP